MNFSSITKFAVLGAALVALTGASPVCTLNVSVESLRSTKGQLLMCLTKQQKYFPECDRDPNALHMAVPAKSGAARFDALPSGEYALSILHDENANDRMDTFAGIPKEGIGFSRNPVLRFGPPKFRNVTFAAESGEIAKTVRMKYFL